MEPYKSYDEALEKFAKDFCKATPRIQPESGVMFYERLLALVKKVDDAAFERFYNGRIAANELFNVSSTITGASFDDPERLRGSFEQVLLGARSMLVSDPAFAKKENMEVVVTVYKK